MKFAFSGFFQDGSFRVLRFESLPREAANGVYWVRADMESVVRHHIPVQDLPLLCRAVLERRSDANTDERTLTYTPGEMRAHADARDEADQHRPRRSFARRPRTPDTIAV